MDDRYCWQSFLVALHFIGLFKNESVQRIVLSTCTVFRANYNHLMLPKIKQEK